MAAQPEESSEPDDVADHPANQEWRLEAQGQHVPERNGQRTITYCEQ